MARQIQQPVPPIVPPSVNVVDAEALIQQLYRSVYELQQIVVEQGGDIEALQARVHALENPTP